jgi:hypothetical protein
MRYPIIKNPVKDIPKGTYDLAAHRIHHWFTFVIQRYKKDPRDRDEKDCTI